MREDIKKLLKAALCCAALVCNFAAEPRTPKLFGAGERKICFVGDSITHHGYYAKQIALYYISRYPELRLKFLNAGFEGGSANTTNIRFDFDVADKRADIYTLMLGMNDVRHSNFTPKALADEKAHKAAAEKNFKTYAEKMAELSARIAGVGRLVLLSPSCYDGIGDIADPYGVDRNGLVVPSGRRAGLAGVNGELGRYGAFVKKLAEENGYGFAEVWGYSTAANAAVVEENPNSSGVGRNRVHPFDFGGFFAAAGFIQSIEGKSEVSFAEIDVQTGAVKTRNAVIKDAQTHPRGAEFEISESALPFPFTNATRACAAYCAFSENSGAQTLKITGLERGLYEVAIDGSPVAFFSADELARGVNLAPNHLTPQFKQAQAVERETEKWRHFTQLQRDLFGTEFIMRADDYSDAAMRKNIEKAKRKIAEGKLGWTTKLSFEYYIANRAKKADFKREADAAMERAYAAAKPRPHKYRVSPAQTFAAGGLIGKAPVKILDAGIFGGGKSPLKSAEIFAPKKSDAALPCVIIFNEPNSDEKRARTAAKYLASKGMVAIIAPCRTDISKRLEWALSVLECVSANAKNAGIDPNRIAAMGIGDGGITAMQLACAANSAAAFDAFKFDEAPRWKNLPNFGNFRHADAFVFGADAALKNAGKISACITVGTNLDMFGARNFNRLFAADADKAAAYSPLEKISRKTPPTMIALSAGAPSEEKISAVDAKRRADASGAKFKIEFYNCGAEVCPVSERVLENAALFIKNTK